jgi:hypothetical protein
MLLALSAKPSRSRVLQSGEDDHFVRCDKGDGPWRRSSMVRPSTSILTRSGNWAQPLETSKSALMQALSCMTSPKL